MIGILIKSVNSDPGTDTCKGKTDIHKPRGEAWDKSITESSEGTKAGNTFISNSELSELRGNKFQLF